MSQQEPIGYGKPPVSTQFKKGQSGNPRGRPKNRHREIPYDAVLGQMVTIREDGRERRVTAAEAFLLQLTQKGLVGDSAAARASLDAIEAARAARGVYEAKPFNLTVSIIGMSIGVILDTLGLTFKRYPRDEKRVRREINPWVVELALARLGDRKLTLEEQREVFANTRTPHKVNWPDWWEVRG